jgi:hypothetical protein
MQLDGKNINIERAEEPTDYFWENLSMRSKSRVKLILVTYLVNFFCLLVALALYIIIYSSAMAIYRSDFMAVLKEQEQIVIRVALTINSLFIMKVNTIFRKIGKLLSKQEHHETRSKYSSSEAIKLTFVMFLNSCFIPMLMHGLISKNEFFENVSRDIYSLTLSMCFVDPIFQILSISWYWKRIKMSSEKRKGDNSNLSQNEANKLFEGNELYISEKYANTILLYLIVCFFSYPIPMIPVVAFFGSIFQYLVEKYIFLRRHKIPEQLGPATFQTFCSFLTFG